MVALNTKALPEKDWIIDPDPPPLSTNSTSKAFVDLLLKHSKKFWPHRYDIRLRVCLSRGGDLNLTTRIKNTNVDGKPFTFTFAYHTYFFVTDISEVRVEGLETLDCLDNLQNGERFTEQGDAIVFESEDKKAKAMGDLADDEYKNMRCVETPVTLKPGEEWKGKQELSAVPSSYCSGHLDASVMTGRIR